MKVFGSNRVAAVLLAAIMLAAIVAVAGCSGSAPSVSGGQPAKPAPVTIATTAPEEPTELIGDETVEPEPTPIVVKVGERGVAQPLAVTVTKVQVTDGQNGYNAEDGRTFVAVTVTVENVSEEVQGVDSSQFEFDNAEGDIVGDLENGNPDVEKFSPDLFDYYDIDPGKKVENKVILAQVDKEAAKGVFLVMYGSDQILQVDLALK